MAVKLVVKCTLVQALRLCTGRTAHRGSRGIALLLLDHGTRRGWGVSVTPRPLFTPGKNPVPLVQEAGCAPGLVWTGEENLTPTGIRFPDRPARSQSLYWLRYPAHSKVKLVRKLYNYWSACLLVKDGILLDFDLVFVCQLWASACSKLCIRMPPPSPLKPWRPGNRNNWK